MSTSKLQERMISQLGALKISKSDDQFYAELGGYCIQGSNVKDATIQLANLILTDARIKASSQAAAIHGLEKELGAKGLPIVGGKTREDVPTEDG